MLGFSERSGLLEMFSASKAGEVGVLWHEQQASIIEAPMPSLSKLNRFPRVGPVDGPGCLGDALDSASKGVLGVFLDIA